MNEYSFKAYMRMSKEHCFVEKREHIIVFLL